VQRLLFGLEGIHALSPMQIEALHRRVLFSGIGIDNGFGMGYVFVKTVSYAVMRTL